MALFMVVTAVLLLKQSRFGLLGVARRHYADDVKIFTQQLLGAVAGLILFVYHFLENI